MLYLLGCRREEIKFTLLGGDEDDQEADASAASRAAVADASASRAQNKNATQALLQSAQNVLNQFQTQGVKFTENDLSRRQLRQVEERDATHALQTRLSGAATTDTGNDFFHVVVARNNNFAWKQLHLIWKRERIYVQNWPQGVRPPVLMKRGKSISALTKPELKLLNTALDARDEPGQGLRFVRRAEGDDGRFFLCATLELVLKVARRHGPFQSQLQPAVAVRPT
jgi:hypothetical protein